MKVLIIEDEILLFDSHVGPTRGKQRGRDNRLISIFVLISPNIFLFL